MTLRLGSSDCRVTVAVWELPEDQIPTEEVGQDTKSDLGTTSQLFPQTSALNCSEGDPQGQRHSMSEITPLHSLLHPL